MIGRTTVDRGLRWPLAAGTLLSAAVLFFVGTGERPLWWAVWCGAFAVLFAAPRLPGLAAFGVAAAAWLLGSLNMWRYTVNILVIPDGHHVRSWEAVVAAIVAFMIVPACAFGLAVLLFRLCVLRDALSSAALVFPAAWVSYEYLSASLSPHGTFGNLAYTQMDVLPLLQLASVTGVWGLSFCVFFLPAAAAALLARAGNGGRKRALAVGAGVSLSIVVGFGVWRIQSAPTTAHSPSVEVGLAASDLQNNVDVQEPGADTERLLRAYEAGAAALVRAGAKVLVLPEKLGVLIPPTIRDDDALMHGFADRSGAVVIVGVIRRAGPIRLNEARIYTPSSDTVLTYDKQHLLPAFESRLGRGTARTLIRKPSGLWGVAVCKDLDFSAFARRYGADGVGLLLVPAWDFGEDDWLHGRMAVMRSVESGFSMARAAKQGLLTINDDRGRVLAELSSTAGPIATLAASVPVQHDDTVYVRYGDWFAWLSAALVLTTVAGLVRPRTAPETLSPRARRRASR